jgi:hypothetical protein
MNNHYFKPNPLNLTNMNINRLKLRRFCRSFFIVACVQRKCAERDGLRAVCRGTSVKAPGPGGFIEVPLHAALSLAQHHSAWWPESAWLTSFHNFRNPRNDSLSDAEFCSLRALIFMRLWRAKRWQTANTQIAPNTYAGHKRKQKAPLSVMRMLFWLSTKLML